MPRGPRKDYPGAWHHVMNRGIAKRSVFESRSDLRYFLSQLARAVRRKEIEVHAFCLMTTHFHLLLKSPEGGLSTAMKRIENSYVRRFNIERRRDGSLFRGRYTSKLVESEAYRRILIRYIHFNPVKAGIVSKPKEYRYSSAWMLSQQRKTKWLSDYWLGAEERELTEACQRKQKAREECFDHPSADQVDVVQRRLATRQIESDPLDDLLTAASPELMAWLRGRAIKADQTTPSSPVLGSAIIARVCRMLRDTALPWEVLLRGKFRDASAIAEIYMLRDLGGMRFSEIARRTRTTQSTARRRYKDHLEAILQEDYGSRLTELVQQALRHSYGSEPGSDSPK